MCYDFEILVQGRDSQQWITLLIFIIIIVFNAVGGLIKASKERSEQNKRKQQDEIAPKRYKPIDQWQGQKKVPGPAQQPTAQRQQQQRQGKLSTRMQEILEQRKRELQQQVERERLLAQRQMRMAESEEQRREKLIAKRRQRQRQQAELERQKKLQQQKLAAIKKAQASKDVKQKYAENDVFDYNLAGLPVEQIRNIIVASEILSKPIALREQGEGFSS